MDYPVVVNSDGVKIKTEQMLADKLYYCIYQDKILVFYKEQNEMLNCYEISEKSIVDEVKGSSSVDIETLLQHFIQKNNLN